MTSSNTVAGQASAGSGIGPGSLHYVLGITKAYTTRVGEGPFPTEQQNEVGQFLGERGHEFGTVTGRKRRCGWFDAVLVRQAVANNGISGIALTKLDVLDGLEEIKVCTGYELDGEVIDYLPAGQGQQARVNADLRNSGRLERDDCGCPQLERTSGAGDQIRSLCRRVDRCADRTFVYEPGTRRHNTCY